MKTSTHDMTITEVGPNGLLSNVCSCGESVIGRWPLTADWADLHLAAAHLDEALAELTEGVR